MKEYCLMEAVKKNNCFTPAHMTENIQSWSLVIFAFNEADTLPEVIEKTFSAAEQLNPLKHEVIVVDDGSTDNTAEIIKELQKTFSNLRIIRHNRNLGIGRSLASGYNAAVYENVCAIPGDGQFNPADLIPYSSFSGRNFISFYRASKRYSAYRQLLTIGNRIINSGLFGLRLKDVNWIKAYKRKQVTAASPTLKSVLLESEICLSLLYAGVTPIEVKSFYYRRQAGVSRGASPKILLNALRDLKFLVKLKFSGQIKRKAAAVRAEIQD